MTNNPYWIYVLEDDKQDFDSFIAKALLNVAHSRNRTLKVIWVRDITPRPRNEDAPGCLSAPLCLIPHQANPQEPSSPNPNWTIVTFAPSSSGWTQSETIPDSVLEIVPWTFLDDDNKQIAEIGPNEIRPDLVILDKYIGDSGDPNTSLSVYRETSDLFHWACYSSEKVINLSRVQVDGEGYGLNESKHDMPKFIATVERLLSENFNPLRRAARDLWTQCLKKASWRGRIIVDSETIKSCPGFPLEQWSDAKPSKKVSGDRVLWKLGIHPKVGEEAEKKNVFYFPSGISSRELQGYKDEAWYGLAWDLLRHDKTPPAESLERDRNLTAGRGRGFSTRQDNGKSAGSTWLGPDVVIALAARRLRNLVFPDTITVTRPEEVRNLYAFLRMMIGPSSHFSGLNDAMDLGMGAGAISSNKHLKLLCPPKPDIWFNVNFSNLKVSKSRETHRSR